MLGLFAGVKPFIKPKRIVDVPRPDNFVFKLHYKVTFAILGVCVILVSTYQYIDSSGSPIQCLFDKGTGIPQKVVNRYCWIMSTFTLPKHYEGIQGEDFIHHGVGNHRDDDERVYHSYYQWVPLVLSIQAIFFYAPHWIWKQLENDHLKKIICGLNKAIHEETEKKKKIEQLTDYMKQRIKTTRDHQMWALKFFFCECLNFINVIVQIVATDRFLGREFTTYGSQVLNFPYEEPENRVDPMSRIFPRMTKCIFHKYGGSGTIQRIDSLCVLSMNIINEKIYIFLWFWFIILALVTGIFLVVRIVQFFLPDIRERLTTLENFGYLDKTVNRHMLESVVKRLNYSDWLIVYYMAQAMEKENFGELIANLADDLPENLYMNSDDELEQGKSITPPPEFDEISDEKKNGNPSLSRSATLRSSSKFRMPSFKKQ